MQPRVPLLSPDSDLSPEQQRVVAGILGRRGGRIPGPYRLALHCPALTEVWHPLGEMLRLKSSFPLRLSEFAILIAARAWDSDYIFNAHASIASEAGLAPSIIDALAKNERPVFDHADEAALYEYSSELCERHAVKDDTYARAIDLFAIPGVVELTALLGYYTMVAMTLAAHQMPLPEGVKPPLAKRGTTPPTLEE